MEERIAECPLGAKCEDVKHENGKPVLYRCPWYIKVRGVNNNTGEEYDHWNCAIAWMPTLMVNTGNDTKQNTMVLNEFKNEVIKKQNERDALETFRALRLNDMGGCDASDDNQG